MEKHKKKQNKNEILKARLSIGYWENSLQDELGNSQGDGTHYAGCKLFFICYRKSCEICWVQYLWTRRNCGMNCSNGPNRTGSTWTVENFPFEWIKMTLLPSFVPVSRSPPWSRCPAVISTCLIESDMTHWHRPVCFYRQLTNRWSKTTKSASTCAETRSAWNPKRLICTWKTYSIAGEICELTGFY